MTRIAYFGPEGTFTEMALLQCLDLAAQGRMDVPGVPLAGAERVSAPSQVAALGLVADGVVDLACVPIESSVEGPVTPTLDTLGFGGDPLQIYAETDLAVSFSIVGTVPLAEARTVGAYPVASAQVRGWLAANAPQADVVPAASNSAAAVDAAQGRVDVAVTTALAAAMHGVPELAAGVADVADARTRFVLCGRPGPAPARTGQDCTAVVLDVPSRPGSLALVMAEFALRGVDLTRIESRPKRTVFGSYVFHFDCVGHIDDPAVGEALRALHRVCDDVRFLGSWPRPGGPGTAPTDPGDSAEWFDRLRRGER
ncbi:Prephenate dehydratase OS=Tsukamurella paurometabola (strain ATCC 8368 / DSM / CCUG 35730 /CIP 100753 / JCM 10117 / KCTC 9821 / NBRC 16120 / NCIMB 702349/ NCTC 13040) OX=521096 GN=pheA PE=4 SV=1 [Tsukamurella paurometabola]|uniref:Prephenate dehydratase n=1 Tax=Tsukamurella paurometabola (strain ATCC 8368 / DSM 20162 / CCUG 35730 / CIP 100753 / JCM 10117 / KCTC 9821 / NBRC 16120 / NCIMB 702349 / NCTC 13040) TaxID=521096 RepID=D5UQ31_TSUPD|nr:prephenate dehydratase [Tsukamurella paurometabola]ADG76799.1 Prephenate dehydratase [Tsukamurella paurometabola DSM 20162]SUP41685.1 Prephenate dehydratase [Tsukamurella paurometabola]